MNRSTEIKSKILGMKFGTACSKLRKEIMFKLIQELNKDVCYRCGMKIKTSKEFSIDHKRSWQLHEAPLSTFFDLDNIAFSHLKCNIIAGKRNRIEAPHGKVRCKACKKFLDEKKFHKDSTRWTGLDSRCVTCKSNRYFNKKKNNG